jgi:DNA modification methylase
LWLDCGSYREIGEALGINHETVAEWTGGISNALGNPPPASRQHFDVWSFQKADGESSYFGRMPPQVVENLLWFYTDPGSIVFDPFAGGDVPVGGRAPLPPTK